MYYKLLYCHYSTLAQEWNIAINLSVCLSMSIFLELIFLQFFMQIPCGRGLVLLWQCYVLPLLWMTSRLAVVCRMAMRDWRRCDTEAESDVYECRVSFLFV